MCTRTSYKIILYFANILSRPYFHLDKVLWQSALYAVFVNESKMRAKEIISIIHKKLELK